MNKKTLKVARWFLTLIIDRIDHDSLVGDFEEIYKIYYQENGRLKAELWLWEQIIKSIPTVFTNSIYWSAFMVTNYIKIAWRNIKKQKGYSFINIAGLAMGIACTILIVLWIQDELSYDRFHENADNLFRTILEFKHPSGDNYHTATTPAPLAQELLTTYPEINNTARYLLRRWTLRTDISRFAEVGALVDPTFVDMFSVKFLKGDAETALSNVSNIVITEALAQKYFGAENPLGKTIAIETWYDAKVVGVIKKFPSNSHLQFDFLIPFQILQSSGWDLTDWEGNNFRTYVLLQKESSPQELNPKIVNLIKTHVPQSTATLHLQPITQIHLYALSGGGLITYIYIFFAMALFILIIACINYMNLATARSANRLKEIGIRRVVGAHRKQVIQQFLSESILLSFIAIVIAMILVYIFLPAFNQIADKQLTVNYSFDMFLILAAITIITGFLSGSYPALVHSSFQTVQVLKNAVKIKGGSSWFRRILVIVQFSISIFLIIGTIIVYKQLHYIRTKNLGYSKENILWLEMGSELAQQYQPLKTALLKNPNILSLTRANTTPDVSESSAEGREVSWKGRKADDSFEIIKVYGVDSDYLKTFKMEMAAGRFFSEEFQTDLNEGFVLNEAAVSAMGIESPVGKQFSLWNFKGKIIGVVKDFHFRPLHYKIEPLVMKMGWGLDNICIRISGRDFPNTIYYIENTLKEHIPDYPFEFKFIDDMIDNRYRAEQRMDAIIKCMTFLALFISCLGLFGLAAFTAEQRTKEVGIRKVMGASVSGIVVLLSKELTLWVILANVIAWPVAYFFMTNWLQNFAYRTRIGVEIFLFSGFLALGIALLTVSFQALKAAMMNPVEALRYE